MRISSFVTLSCCLFCVCGIWPLITFAGQDAKPPKDSTNSATPDDGKKESDKVTANKDATNKSNPKAGEINAEREKTALDFAAQHHPELAALITPLKTSNPKEYQRAVRELFRTTERLTAIRVKEPVRYDLELEAWKLQSQVRLLTARLTMEADPTLEAQLKDTLKKKADNRLNLLQNERETLQSRMEQVQKEIDQAGTKQEQLVQQEYDRLLKKTARGKGTVVPKATSSKPAGNKKGNVTKSPSTTSPGK